MRLLVIEYGSNICLLVDTGRDFVNQCSLLVDLWYNNGHICVDLKALRFADADGLKNCTLKGR